MTPRVRPTRALPAVWRPARSFETRRRVSIRSDEETTLTTDARPPLSRLSFLALSLLFVASGAATAQARPGGGDDAAELAKKLSNPVSSLISVPLQNNWDAGVGTNDVTKYTLNFQPVIPISLGERWNLITRTIVPYVSFASPAPGAPGAGGLGDTMQSFFFSPKAPTKGGWMMGGGPVVLYPTATSRSTGSGKWGAGPTLVLLKQESGWTYGILANHVWSFAGPESRANVSATFLQPFVSYMTKSCTTFGVNTESTYDWAGSQWSIPLNATVTQLLKVAGRPVSLTLGGRAWAKTPAGGPDWGLRFVVTFLFPE